MQIQSNFSLKPYNTFGIDIRTRYFSAFSDIELLKELTTHAPIGIGVQLRTFILGGGSNILFTKDFDGLVLADIHDAIRIFAVLTCLISSGHFKLGERPRLLQLNSTAA